MLAWLERRSAAWRKRGITGDPISKVNENQIRKLESICESRGSIGCVTALDSMAHDLAVVDFRLLLEKSLRDRPHLILSDWLHEGVFRSEMDIMEYEVEVQSGTLRKVKKRNLPGRIFVIDDSKRKQIGQPKPGEIPARIG